MADIFNIQIFFVIFRETLEGVVIISILLAFLKQGLANTSNTQIIYKKLVWQVWFGTILGVVFCLIVGGIFIGVFYSIGSDLWQKSEDLWTGIFCIIASVLISMMGISMLRVNKMKEKWRIKIAQALLKVPEKKIDRFKIGYLSTKYCMFILPFITCIREGLEAVVFVGGVGLNQPASSFPLPVICGFLVGISVGLALYYWGSTISIKVFLIISTCILYLIASGLLSRGVWYFETNSYNQKTGGDASENGSGPGTYDISKSVWHVNCCNPQTDNGWDIFNALLGWQNSATYGSVISYCLYWFFLIVILLLMSFEERHGYLPFAKNLTLAKLNPIYHIRGKNIHLTQEEQDELFDQVKNRNVIGKQFDFEESSIDISRQVVFIEKN